MTKFFTLFLFITFSLSVNAQSPLPTTQPYGKVDNADLEMTSCDFEKDANAEVLFDKGSVYYTTSYDMVFERHIRIKIFNDKAKDFGNVKIAYQGGDHSEFISGVQAETINLDNGAIKITKVDKKQQFTQQVDRVRSLLSFAFPDVRPGSIIEYKYTITTPYLDDFPDWYFQNSLPTRYSEINAAIPSILYYKNLVMVTLPYVKNTDEVKALANIPSISDEPFMSSKRDNAQRILYELKSINDAAYMKTFSGTWDKVGEDEAGFDDFGMQVRRKLPGEDLILNQAKALSSTNSKIAFIFNEVKNAMKWDNQDVRFTNDGTAEAWQKKTGNCTEINLIVCHLLKKAGVNACPMLVSTREHGKVNPAYPSRYQFNRAVTYVPIDSANYYILDATSKYNVFNEIPSDILNTYGFWIDKDNKKYDLLFIQKTNPVRQMVLVNAEIKADGKMSGTAQINSFSYNRLYAVEKYKTDGEQKYMDYLRDDDNNLKIADVKFSNMEVDSLPLTQNINFNLALSGSDDNYIYFNPNLFTGLHENPFLSETRFTDIDFKYKSSYSINGIYKLPAGYKIDGLPKNATMAMSDNSIVFRRMTAEQDGAVVVRYVIDYRKSLFFKENYTEIHAFFKKMHEMLDEQIVLKKS